MAGRDGALEVMGITDLAKQVGAQYKKYTIPVATKNIIYHFLTRERRKTYGPAHPDQTIYIIRSIADHSPFYIGPVHNLLANYFYVLSHIQYARTKGWIPVVDQLNYPVYNSQSTPIHGTRNPWEYFWQQPGGVSLEEAYQSKNVVLSKQSWFWEWDMGYSVEHYTDLSMILQFYEASKQIPMNLMVQEYVEKMKRGIFPKIGKVLGVAFRYGGHAKSCPHHGQGHPIQPEADELISVVKQCMEQWEMDYIFLTSDEMRAVEHFRREFGKQLIVLNRERMNADMVSSDGKLDKIYQKDKIYQTTLNYLTEMELLAKCDSLIGSVTSGLRYAIVRNGGKYSQVKILDYGFFPDYRK